MKGPVNPVLNYLKLSPPGPGLSPTTQAPRRRPQVTRSPQTTTSHRASPTEAVRRSHTTERIEARGLRFPHFPSIEITDNSLDSRGRSYGTAWRRNEKKLFTTTPVPSRQLGYNIHPVHKYQHFDSFPHSFDSSSYNHPAGGNLRGKYHTRNNNTERKTVVSVTPSSYDKTTTQDTFSSPVSNNNNFLVDWGTKVGGNSDVTKKREILMSHKAKTKPLMTHPGVYNKHKPMTDLSTTARYDASRFITPSTRPPPLYRGGPSPASGPVTEVNTPPPVPFISDRAHHPAQSMSNFYSDFRGFYGGQHPKPYQPAITFLDSVASPQPLTDRRHTPTIGSRSQTVHPFVNLNVKNNQGALGVKEGQHGNVHSVQKLENKNISFNYDPFAFNFQQPQPQLPAELRGEGFENNFVDFSKQNSQSRNYPVSGAERGNMAPNRPDDTKYSLSVDPRRFFDNNFPVSDKFSVYTKTNNNFTPAPAVTGGAKSYHDGQAIRVNERKLDVTKEKRNLNTNKEDDKMLSLRSKLFNGREPGGYYIKVFNNDGNNYSIRDGQVPRSEAVDRQHTVGSQNKSGKNSKPMNHDEQYTHVWPGSRPSVPVSAQQQQQQQQNRGWTNDNLWNSLQFESRDLS